jgi:hypothetical protein
MSYSDLIARLDQKSQSSFKPWSDLQINIWHRIITSNTIPTKNGEALVLDLVNLETNDTIKVFATSMLKKELESYDNKNKMFVRSLGKPQGKKYYKFDLIKD